MTEYGEIRTDSDEEYRLPGLGEGSVSFNYEEPMLDETVFNVLLKAVHFMKIMMKILNRKSYNWI